MLLPKLDNICKNKVSSIFQYLVVFKGLRGIFTFYAPYPVNSVICITIFLEKSIGQIGDRIFRESNRQIWMGKTGK